jgi:hypothetical protein
VGFALYFARRSEPLNVQPDEPLAEVSGAGEKWIFTGMGDESTQVRSTIGGSVRNVMLGVTGTLIALGHGESPGEGSCEHYFVVGEVEVAAQTSGALRRVRGGTGDLQLRLANGSAVWCTSHHCRPWLPSDADMIDRHESDARPSSPAPPLEPGGSPVPVDCDAPLPPPPPLLSPIPASHPPSPRVPEEPSGTEQRAPMEGAFLHALLRTDSLRPVMYLSPALSDSGEPLAGATDKQAATDALRHARVRATVSLLIL